MEEYVTDELAEISDDEKRLYRAETPAGRKLKANKAKAKKQPPSRRRGSFSGTNNQSYLGQISTQQATKSSVYGPCFQCGMIGHFRHACPLLILKTQCVPGAT